jgi:hypothetical protein
MIKKTIKKIINRKKVDDSPSRITNGTIDEHREEVLSKGRKFKYPLQYAKNKLIINTVVLSTITIAAVSVFGWVQMYKVQNTSDIAYRVTQFIPLNVAKVDGKGVLYSDYLMQLRSSITVIERQSGKLDDSEDSKRQMEYYKRIALDNSEVSAYVMKLAKELDIKIDRERIKTVFNEHRDAGGVEVTEKNFIKIINDNYGLSRSEYERMFIELPLLRQEVQVRIDDDAKDIVKRLEAALKSDGSNFDLVSGEFAKNEQVSIEPSGGLVSSVSNLDGGRAAKAYSLEKNRVSEPFLSKSGDSYYIVKTINKQDDKVEYISIRVSLTELRRRIDQLRSDGKIEEYIKIDMQTE